MIGVNPLMEVKYFLSGSSLVVAIDAKGWTINGRLCWWWLLCGAQCIVPCKENEAQIGSCLNFVIKSVTMGEGVHIVQNYVTSFTYDPYRKQGTDLVTSERDFWQGQVSCECADSARHLVWIGDIRLSKVRLD